MNRQLWSTDVFPPHIYVHWPFCVSKCSYCDFVAFEQHHRFTKRYYDALCTEIEQFCVSFPEVNRKIRTLFFGGGTPSLCPLEYMERFFSILNNLSPSMTLDSIEEVTLEANPTNVSDDQLARWRQMGVNRLSFGVQVLDDNVNALLGRIQRSKDVENTIERAARHFDNISVDLIVGLPGVSRCVWDETLSRVLSWPIKHVSMYMLTVYEHTPLFYSFKSGKMVQPSEDWVAECYQDSAELLERRGFCMYELSNFAKSGFESIHNRAYWEGAAYKGFGLSAASFDGRQRSVNEKNLMRYFERIEEGKEQREGRGGLKVEQILPDQRRLECIMLGLRMKKGLKRSELASLSKFDLCEELDELLEQLLNDGLIEMLGDTVRLTFRGMMLEDEIVTRL